MQPSGFEQAETLRPSAHVYSLHAPPSPHSAAVLQSWTFCAPVHVALHSVESDPPLTFVQQTSLPVQSAFSSHATFGPAQVSPLA